MRYNRHTTDVVSALVTFVCIFAILLGVWVFRSHMEAKAYNRVTGADVTTWEAMWVELRVDSAARGGRE